MVSVTRNHTERRVEATERRQQRALLEQQEASRLVDENTARLKALRLERDTAEKARTDAKVSAMTAFRKAASRNSS